VKVPDLDIDSKVNEKPDVDSKALSKSDVSVDSDGKASIKGKGKKEKKI